MRFLKQLGYGSIFLLILGSVGAGIYRVYFYEAPTCFDNIKNQDESEADCDGSCISCELKNAKLGTNAVSIIEAGGNKTTLMTVVSNPVNYSVNFEYRINVLGKFGTSLYAVNGFSSVGPRGERYIVIPGIGIPTSDAEKANIEIIKMSWSEDEGARPRSVNVTDVETTLVDGSIRVTGKLFNDSLDIIERARATAIIRDKDGNVLSASAVDVMGVGVSREKAFTVFFPKLDLEVEIEETDTQVFGEVTPSL